MIMIMIKGDEISRSSHLGPQLSRSPFWAIGVLLAFRDIQLLPMQNLTSYSCSLTPISYIGDGISRQSRLIFEIPIVGYLGIWVFGGVFSFSSAKSDVKNVISLLMFIFSRNSCATFEVPGPAGQYSQGTISVICKLYPELITNLLISNRFMQRPTHRRLRLIKQERTVNAFMA